jgi:hypothetical protein
VATRGIYSSVTADYPTNLTIGPSYFESYQTWPGVKFVHGFNLGKNSTVSAKSLTQSAAYACKALSEGSLLEMGNEPDLYKEQSVRPKSWSESDYVKDWADKVATVEQVIKSTCGDGSASGGGLKWIAPSFAGTKNSLDAVNAWKAGLGDKSTVAKFSQHKYVLPLSLHITRTHTR